MAVTKGPDRGGRGFDARGGVRRHPAAEGPVDPVDGGGDRDLLPVLEFPVPHDLCAVSGDRDAHQRDLFACGFRYTRRDGDAGGGHGGGSGVFGGAVCHLGREPAFVRPCIPASLPPDHRRIRPMAETRAAASAITAETAAIRAKARLVAASCAAEPSGRAKPGISAEIGP